MNYVSPVERYGFEDEETRRKREEEERKRMGETEVGSTTEKTYMDGSKTITQTREVPGGAQAMRPVMPIQPTSPDDFVRIRQIESGNRDFTPQGQPVTSPKGAMFASQVMPATAQQPGFGIRPAQSQTPEEYNRVGREYFDAMRNRYNDDVIAAAAYNAGPGRVDQALRKAQETGQPFINFLPQETQQYVQKFSQARQPAMAQPQQQMTMPPIPQGARPLAMPSVGASAEGVEGEQVAQQRMMDYTNRFQQSQNDVNKLLALREDTTAPSFIQDIARDRAYELLTTEKNKLAAQREVNQLVQSGDSKKIASVLSSEPEDEKGSYLKLLLLGFVSPESARVEAQKLGIVPTKYESAVITNNDGTTKAVQVKVRADGKVTGGFDLQGNQLSTEDLSKALSQTTGKNVTTGAEAYRDSTTGKIYYRQNDQRGNIFFTEPGGARYGGDTSKLQRVTDVSALQRIDYQTANDLFKKNQGNIADTVKEYGIKLGRPLTGEEYQQVVSMVGPGAGRPSAVAQPAMPAVPQQPAQAQPSAPAIAQQPAATVAPTATGVGVSTQPLPTLGSLERAGTIATTAQKQFVEKTVPTVAEDANNARQVAGTRREQLDIIRTNPSILDIYNGSGSGYDQARNVITKIVTGVYNADNQDQLFKDIKNISILPNERAALEQFANLNMTVNPKTLRANAGPGAVSNAEQQANQKANIQNVAELTPLAALQGIYRSKFMSELADAKEAFLAKNQDTLKTDGDFNRAWAKEQNKWFKAHEAIAQARAEYLKPFNPGPSASKQELNAFRDKVFKAFELYPSPTFDTTSGWSYGTKNAEREIVKKWRESGALK